MAVLQFKNPHPAMREAEAGGSSCIFGISELKHVFLVDEDVDPFDSNDVLWALNTRYQGDVDTVFIPGVRCHPLDPSQDPEYSPSVRDRGITCKTIFDCTVPYSMKEKFERSKFMELDPVPFAPQLFDRD